MLKRLLFLFVLPAVLLFACSNNDNEELAFIEVDFVVPEEAIDAGETVELLANVTYGDDIETDAVVKYEVWLSGDQDNSETFEATNNGDGSYTADYTFEEAGTYEMYAHTDAQDMHTMPKKEVVVE